jgi:hypothetical protein
MKTRLLSLVVLLVCVTSLPAWSQDLATSQSSPTSSAHPALEAQSMVPHFVRFSGVMTDASGKPATGRVAATFSLYELEEGGNPLWMETQNVQLDEQGRYTVLLGATQAEGLPLDLFTTGKARWMGVQLPGAAEEPRVLMVGMPYALKASDADTLGGKPASAYVLSQDLVGSASGLSTGVTPAVKSGSAVQSVPAVQSAPAPKAGSQPNSSSPAAVGGSGKLHFIPIWTSSTTLGNSVIFQDDGNIGVGTKSPGAKLTAVSPGTTIKGSSSGAGGIGVFGHATSKIGNGTGVFGLTASPGAAGVVGVANVGGTGLVPTGVYGQSSDPNGDGVGGNASATSGNATGVIGASASATGAGVAGFATATSGTAVGTTGASSATSGTGVGGFATAASGVTYGVTGSSVSPTGYGALGQNTATTGGIGIYGVTYSTSGNSNGVVGQVASNNGAGVAGVSISTTGVTAGVYGTDASPNGTGVVGIATATDGGIGVIGSTVSPNGEAGIFIANAGQGLLLQGLSGSGLTQVFSVDAAGNLDISGNLTVSGSKSARMKMQDGREVALYAVESPENWFEDFGTGHLQSGAASVSLEAGFLQTVDTAADYHVFLTPNGDCRGLYVASKSPGAFQVRELGGGNASVAFDYRIVARRRGFENVRLQEVHLPQVSPDMKTRVAHLQEARPLPVTSPLSAPKAKVATRVLPTP